MNEYITVAIVDDHTMFRKGLRNLINLFPRYKVVLDATDGEDFINQLNPENLPSIVLMDIKMPKMDGYATSEWLKLNYPQINVIALSTMESDSAIIRMIKSGARGYLLKDADPSELTMAFDEVISQGHFYNELITRKVINSVSDLFAARNPISALSKLSAREIEFLKYACTELSYKEIALKMFLSVRTVESYRDNLCEKLNLRTRIGLAIYAIKNQIVSTEEL
jgi:DNA-binding NarL/FixJ family response regulator